MSSSPASGADEKITVKIVHDTITTPLRTTSKTTIGELKKQYNHGVSKGLIFKFMGMVLKDDRDLDSYTVSDGDTIQALVDEHEVDTSNYVRLKLRYGSGKPQTFKMSPVCLSFD